MNPSWIPSFVSIVFSTVAYGYAREKNSRIPRYVNQFPWTLMVVVVYRWASPTLKFMSNATNPIEIVGALTATILPRLISWMNSEKSVDGIDARSAVPEMYACSPGSADVSQVTSTVPA